MIVDPLLPLRPLRRGNRKQPLTGLQMLEKKGHERLIVPGTLDLERYPALDRIGKTMKLDDQEELLWRLTARCEKYSDALSLIAYFVSDPAYDYWRLRYEVLRIIRNASERVEGTCTNN